MTSIQHLISVILWALAPLTPRMVRFMQSSKDRSDSMHQKNDKLRHLNTHSSIYVRLLAAEKFLITYLIQDPAVYPNFDLYLPLPEVAVQQPMKPSKVNISRLTHLELHAMVMMEKAQAKSKGSFGRLESFLDMPDIDSKVSFIHEHEDIDHYLQEKSISNVARNIRISTVPVPTRDIRRMTSAPAYKSGSAVFLDSPTEKDQDQPILYEAPPLNALNVQDRGTSKLSNIRERLVYQEEPSPYRKSLNIYDRNVTRSSGLREPQGKPPIPPKPPIVMTRRRDSLVLQRVKALDNNGEATFLTVRHSS